MDLWRCKQSKRCRWRRVNEPHHANPHRPRVPSAIEGYEVSRLVVQAACYGCKLQARGYGWAGEAVLSAPLKRKVALLEAKLAAEKEAHAKTFRIYGDLLSDLVTLKMRHEAAIAALAGDDYFEGEK